MHNPQISSIGEPALQSQSSRLKVFIQDACYQHRYIRSKNVSNIYERPERLKAVKLGISAAMARLELEQEQAQSSTANSTRIPNADDLAKALDKLELDPASLLSGSQRLGYVHVLRSTAFLNLLDNAAVKFVHGDIDGDVYLEKLIAWAKNSSTRIADGQSEIPQEYNQGDLYCKYL
jgi:histone deacetylase HOS3